MKFSEMDKLYEYAAQILDNLSTWIHVHSFRD